MDFVVSKRDRLTDRRYDALGQTARFLHVDQAVRKDHEFVAAVTNDQVAGANAVSQAFGDNLEDRVSGEMASVIVHLLKVIQVDEQKSQSTTWLARP